MVVSRSLQPRDSISSMQRLVAPIVLSNPLLHRWATLRSVTGGRMADEVRYQPNGNNKVLRHVLRQVWDRRCYWCRNFKDYLDLEIDHILPQNTGGLER